MALRARPLIAGSPLPLLVEPEGAEGAATPDTLADLAAVRAAYRASEVVFPWRAGDLLLLDNHLALHGR